MIGFFDFLVNNPIPFVSFTIMGSIFGLFHGLGESWKYKIGATLVGAALWGVTLGTLNTWVDYDTYKRHYVTCDKYEAKQAGYIFSENRCWKPVQSYIKVSDTSKTKQDLLNGN